MSTFNARAHPCVVLLGLVVAVQGLRDEESTVGTHSTGTTSDAQMQDIGTHAKRAVGMEYDLSELASRGGPGWTYNESIKFQVPDESLFPDKWSIGGGYIYLPDFVEQACFHGDTEVPYSQDKPDEAKKYMEEHCDSSFPIEYHWNRINREGGFFESICCKRRFVWKDDKKCSAFVNGCFIMYPDHFRPDHLRFLCNQNDRCVAENGQICCRKWPIIGETPGMAQLGWMPSADRARLQSCNTRRGEVAYDLQPEGAWTPAEVVERCPRRGVMYWYDVTNKRHVVCCRPEPPPAEQPSQ